MKNSDHYLLQIIVFPVALVVAAIALISSLVVMFYNPEIGRSSIELRDHTEYLLILENINMVRDVVAEKRELLIYVLSAIAAPIVVFFSLYLLNRSHKNKTKLLSNKLTWLLTLLLVELFSLAIFNTMSCLLRPLRMRFSYLDVSYCAAMVSFLIMIYGALVSKLRQKKNAKIFIIIASLAAIFIISFSLSDENFTEDFFENYSPVAYPIIQTYLGKAPLIDLKSLYGLHPYFFQIFLHILPVNFFAVSCILAASILVSTLFIIYYIFSLSQNKLLALMGFFGFLFMQHCSYGGTPKPIHTIFQCEAVRMLFLSMFLVFTIWYGKKPSNLKYYFGLGVFSLGVLWNLDSGLLAFLSLVIFFAYERFGKDISGIKTKTVAKFAIQIFGTLILTIAVFAIFLRLIYGTWPIFSYLIGGQAAIAQFGYSTFKMPLVGLWYIPTMIYAAGLALTIHYLFKKEFSIQNAAILNLTILGIGLFIYYVGKSDDFNIVRFCGFPALILLIIFADKFCTLVTKDKLIPSVKFKYEALPFMIPLFLVSYLGCAFILSFDGIKLTNNYLISRYITKDKITTPYWVEEANFIKKHIGNLGDNYPVRSDILLFDNYDKDAYLSTALKIKFPLNYINIRHVFYKNDFEAIYQYIKNRQSAWIIISESRSMVSVSAMSRAEILSIKSHSLQNGYKLSACKEFDDGKEKLAIYKRL